MACAEGEKTFRMESAPRAKLPPAREAQVEVCLPQAVPAPELPGERVTVIRHLSVMLSNNVHRLAPHQVGE